MNPIAKAILVIAIAAGVVLPVAIWNGFVIHLMWLWFVVPLGVPAIGIAHSIGFSLLIALFRRDKSDSKTWWVQTGELIAKSVLILAIGYLAKSWM